MKNGESVNITAYGDSTTCGWETTNNVGVKINTAGGYSGDMTHALGDNWDIVAVNAFPAKLQTILRDMYGNNNIKVHNSGFGGQQLANGWAYDNFDAAVRNNVFYGVPDAVIINFGLNESTAANFNAVNYLTQYDKLIKKILGYGVLPIIMSSDAIAMIDGAKAGTSNIDTENARIYDQIAMELSAKYSIPFVDMNLYLRDWFNNNMDGFKYRSVQADGVHVNDDGHNYKAGVLALHLGYDVAAWNNQTEMIISPEDNSLHADSNDVGAPFFDWPTDQSWSKTARNFVSNTVTLNKPLLEAWVFVAGDQPIIGFNTLGVSNAQPKVKVYKNGDSTPYYNEDYGISPAANNFVYDFKCTKLKYGLNKVTIIPDVNGASFFLNYLWLRKWTSSYKINPAEPYFDTTYWASLGGVYIQKPNLNAVNIPVTVARSGKFSIPEVQENGGNFAQLKKIGDKIQIDATLRLRYGGLVLFPATEYNLDKSKYICITAWANPTAGVDYIIHYPYIGTTSQTGTDSSGVLGNEVKLCIDLERKASNTLNVKVYLTDRSTVAKINYDILNCNHFSGILNGLIAVNEPNNQAFAEINSMSVYAFNQ